MAHSTDEGLGDEMLNWLETNVPALRHVVVPNPGGRRWLELWNMAITQKAEEYYRIVNNLLDNSGGAQDDAMSSAALNMGYLLWKLTQVVDEDLEWRNKNKEQYSPPAPLEPTGKKPGMAHGVSPRTDDVKRDGKEDEDEEKARHGTWRLS